MNWNPVSLPDPENRPGSSPARTGRERSRARTTSETLATVEHGHVKLLVRLGEFQAVPDALEDLLQTP